MTDSERAALLELGMFDGPWLFCGETLRPITLGSLHACHCLGLPLHRGVAGFDTLAEESKPLAIARFIWAHTAAPATIKFNVLTNSFPMAPMDPAPLVVEAFRAALTVWHALVEAASVDPIPRASWHDNDAEPAPRGQIDPSYLADFVWMLTKGQPTPERINWVLWELPFVQALQFYHCRLRESRYWTVPKGASVEDQAKALSQISKELDKSAAEDWI